MAVTFTHSTPGTYDAATDTWGTPVTTTVTGEAVRVRGDPETYRALGLIQSENPTLLFTPATYGEAPEPGYTVEWSNVVYTVRDVNPVAPDGVMILARVVVSR